MQQAQLERHYQRLRAEELMRQGVTLLDPQRLDVRGEISVGRDVLIDVNVVLEGRVVIEDDVRIGPNCVIRDSVLRRGAVIKANSHLEGAELGEGSDAGPFARLRPGSVLGARAHVGNFVELKNARLGEGSKAGHLSYLAMPSWAPTATSAPAPSPATTMARTNSVPSWATMCSSARTTRWWRR